MMPESAILIFMITILVDSSTRISQEFYHKLISSLKLHKLSCSCGHSGCLTVHAYYFRKLKQGSGDICLSICRVKCSVCGKTHALLPSSIVPYSRISLPDQAEIIMSAENKSSALPVMERTPSIDENNVYSILRRYRIYWKLRLLILGDITALPLSVLVSRCFRTFDRQFLQIKSTSNILFVNTT